MTTRDSLDRTLAFLFRYLWLLCCMVLAFEFVSSAWTAWLFLQFTSRNVAHATRLQIENKLSITWTLADALVRDMRLSDVSIRLEERAALLKPYAETYDLFLIGLTDLRGTIASSYDDTPGNIGARDYFKRVIRTGTPEITDAFLAGADGATLNYTICVPYYDKSGSIGGAIIMSIPFSGLNSLISESLPHRDMIFTLIGSDNRIMADGEPRYVGMQIWELFRSSQYVSEDDTTLVDRISHGDSGSYWTLDHGRLLLVQYAPIARTNWKLLSSVDAVVSTMGVWQAFAVKALLYIGLFTCISLFGKRYTRMRLAKLNTLIRQVTELQLALQQKKLLVSDEFTELACISEKGLLDELTALPTRTVLLHQMQATLQVADTKQTMAFIIIDLDDLKQINDTYGHSMGDDAIRFFGTQLREFAEAHHALASRMGGDEFAVYVEFSVPGALINLLQELEQRLRGKLPHESGPIPVHASLGAAVFPTDGTDFEALYDKADVALYAAKQAGKNTFRVWQERRGTGKRSDMLS